MRDYFKAIPAAYVLLRKDGKILLLRRSNTGYADGLLALPAGHLDGDELASSAAIREAREEIGVRIVPENLRCVHVAHRLNRDHPGQERVDFFFETSEWTGEPVNCEPEKCSEIGWFSYDAPPADLAPYLQLILKNIRRGEFFSEHVTEPK